GIARLRARDRRPWDHGAVRPNGFHGEELPLAGCLERCVEVVGERCVPPLEDSNDVQRSAGLPLYPLEGLLLGLGPPLTWGCAEEDRRRGVGGRELHD